MKDAQAEGRPRDPIAADALFWIIGELEPEL